MNGPWCWLAVNKTWSSSPRKYKVIFCTSDEEKDLNNVNSLIKSKYASMSEEFHARNFSLAKQQLESHSK